MVTKVSISPLSLTQVGGDIWGFGCSILWLIGSGGGGGAGGSHGGELYVGGN